jgi:uncharacterized RDD family membrane protein YckC
LEIGDMRTPAVEPGLAPRTFRLIAVMVDLIVALPLLAGVAFGAAGTFGFGLAWLKEVGHDRAGVLPAVGSAASAASLVAGLIGLTLLTLYQWYLLAVRGQTIGKRAVGIRIVDLQGRPAGFVQALVMRVWIFGFLMSVIGGLVGAVVPFAALALGVLDLVLVFGPDRRCLHDLLAGTQVRWVAAGTVRWARLGLAFAATAALACGAYVLVAETRPPGSGPGLAAPERAAAGDHVQRSAPPAAPPPVAVAPPSESAPETEPARTVYTFTDDDGVVHYVDDLSAVPHRLRARAHAVNQ